MPLPLRKKHIVTGITGGIAAYKSADLVRRIIACGATAEAVMTGHACEFIAPLTLHTLTERPVVTGLFSHDAPSPVIHIDVAKRADLVAVVPATANILAKAAAGIADDALSSILLATPAPVLFAPAMNTVMWDHPAVQENVARLAGRGCHIVYPESGELACGDEGRGRLADLDVIIDEIAAAVSPKDFEGRRVIVTAGPTREYSDPVRFISNPSSGKMGYALARALRHRGASIVLVSGPVALTPPPGVERVEVESAARMEEAVLECYPSADIVIKAAAVADYRPAKKFPQKMKKDDAAARWDMERTPDILASLGKDKQGRVLVGFAAETQSCVDAGREKLQRKNLDMIVVNDVSSSDIGFGADMNRVTCIYADGRTEEIPTMSKDELAHALLDRIAGLLKR